MGGDKAPHIVVEGAHLAVKRYPDAKFIIFGDENQIKPLISKHSNLNGNVEVRHTPDKVASDEKPSVALRSGRNSSMRLAINAVAKGEADCIVSAGNTGALMAMAKFVLKVLPSITRPALASYLPNKVKDRDTVMLDLGANVDCSPKNLLEFGILGGIFSREILKVDKPRIGLLNIGSEAMKGHEEVKGAAELFEKAAVHLPGEYIGFVEGDDIGSGVVDVVVADGFIGNISLKTMEGTAKLLASMFKQVFTSSLLSKIALVLLLPSMIFALPAILVLKKRVDPRYYNGAPLMGLKGLCIKSHGGTDAVGFANAIGVAADMALMKFNQKVKEAVEEINKDIEATNGKSSE